MEDQYVILIIDDDEVDRMQLSRALRHTGLQVSLYQASGIDEAYKIIEARPWDCIFLDYLLPGGDGLEVLNDLRAKGFEMPVVIVTSQGDEKIAVQAMKAGGSDYISKNLLNADSVAKVLLSAVRNHKAEKERQRTAKALADSEARLKEAQRIANIGSWELDLRNLQGYWTDQVFAILGYVTWETNNVPFDRFQDHVLKEDLQKLRQLQNHCIQNDKPLKADVRITNINGEIRQVEVQGRLLRDEKGKPAKLVGTVQDITDRKRIEQDLIEARIMAERNAKAKEEFLANMSHEIRTPMNAILGFAKLLDETELDAQQREFLKAIDYSGEALLSIINDILDLSKIEAGKFQFDNSIFSLKEMLAGLEAIFAPRAKAAGIELISTLGPGVPEFVEGDSARLNQVMINLIGNAIKFTKEGEINVEVKLKSEQADRVGLLFEVADTGIGIPPDKLEAIFESFTQASSDTTRKYGGTGLGLTICKRIVELQGGKIGVQSEDGEGSTFYFELNFELPSEVKAPQSRKKIAEIAVQQLSLDVLLAEDNKLNQRLATILLEKIGHKVRLATTGTEVLAEIASKVPDIVLMDIQMPEMDGYEATRQIRQHTDPLVRQLPILALTAHALREEVEKCEAVGMNGFLSKPFQIEALQAKIIQLTGKEAAVAKSNGIVSPANTLEAIELSQLDALTQGNPEFRAELIGIFLDEVPKNLEKAKIAVQNRNGEALYQAAHAMKPSLLLFGLPAAGTIVTNLEELGKSQASPAAMQAGLKDLENILSPALKAISTL